MELRSGKMSRLAVVSSLCILVLLLLLLFPVSEANTNAVESPVSRVAAEPSSVAISAQASINVDVNATEHDGVQVTSAPIWIKTTNASSYSIYLSTADGSPFLRSRTVTNYAAIAPLPKPATLNSFIDNTWGVNLSLGDLGKDALFEAVPKTPTVIKTQTVASLDTQLDKWSLSLASKLTTDIPADTYSNKIIISVVAQPVIPKDLSTINTMQEMTSEICANTKAYVSVDDYATKQLVDERDNKKYWVAKLKDGNCWMVQNLDLDIQLNEYAQATSETGILFTSENTNIATASWSMTDNAVLAPTTILTNSTGVADDTISTSSWDAGKIVFINPTASSACSNIAGELNNLASCRWFQEVDDMTDTYEASETSSINEDGTEYDAHYLVGNYYSWGAATAGTSKGISSGNVSGSICPKGWKLPTSNEQVAMLANYGANTVSNNGLIKITMNPVYSVRSGDIFSGYLGSAGYYGLYWSSTAYSSSAAYNYYFNADNISPRFNYYRRSGHSIRCIAE